MTEIKELINMIKNKKLRQKVKEIITDPIIVGNYEKLSLQECPAGIFQHHSYEGGLLQHTQAVTILALTMCDIIEEIYGGKVDRDSVIAGSLLHDIMKCYSYTRNEEGYYRTSELGEKIDHLTLLVSELYKRDFPIEVLHIAATHHGDVSPLRPRTIEALIVSIADLADSELSRKILRAAEYLLKKGSGKTRRVSSSKEAIEIVHTKARNGWEGLKNLEKLKQKKSN
jgi:7,8-dihydroneopterin 2',3'-cyclic phosphate phosphodiesterase